MYVKIKCMKKKIENVFRELSAIVWKEDNWYIAKCLEVEVASQGKTKEKALSNLQEALELYFENDSEKLSEVDSFPHDFSIERIQISNA